MGLAMVVPFAAGCGEVVIDGDTQGGALCSPEDDGNSCTDDVCEGEVPAHPPSPAGKACGAAGMHCDGQGTCVACASAVDCPAPVGPCQVAVCAGGACSAGAAPDGAACDDLDPCTAADTCVGGACVSGSPVVCPAGQSCEGGVCAAAMCTGATGYPGPAAQWFGMEGISWVGAADMDGDGALDVVASSATDVRVARNVGKGVLAPPDVFPALPYFYVPVLADLNGDGAHDLAIAHREQGSGSDGLSVLLNQGNGLLSAPVDFPAGESPTTVAAADLNGDGALDLAVAAWDVAVGGVSVLLNDGTGAFSAPALYGPGLISGALAAGDLDGDGAVDIVAANPATNSAAVLFGDGNGSLGAPVEYAANLAPYGVVISDLNGDGALDFVTANYDGGDVSVFLNEGSGAFASAVSYPAGDVPRAVVAGDLDHDGAPDLVVANGAEEGTHGLTVLRNQGDGTFLPAAHYPANVTTSSVALGDMNGDGHLDALANAAYWPDYVGGVTVMLGLGDGALLAPVPHAEGETHESATVGDLNGDGAPDLAVTNMTGGDVSVLFNTGGGAFAAPVHLAAGSHPRAAAIEDLDGDGQLDLAVVNEDGGDVSVLLNQGGGALVIAASVTAGQAPRALTVADFDGDGLPDLAVANHGGSGAGSVSVHFNEGNGAFTAAAGADIHAAGPHPTAVAASDLDGDGAPDLAVTSDAGLSVLINEGGGAFAPAVSHAAVAMPASVAAGDLNGDGLPDLVVASGGGPGINVEGRVGVYLNEGGGAFADAALYTASIMPGSVVMTDLDGDGKLDLAVASHYYNDVTLLYNQGDGTFSGAAPYSACYYPQQIAAGDLDGDGRPDLVVAGADSVDVMLATCLPWGPPQN